jgi:hypothetical protein
VPRTETQIKVKDMTTTTQVETQAATKTSRTRTAGIVTSALAVVWGIGMALVSPIGPLYLPPPMHTFQHLYLGVLTLLTGAALTVFLRKSRAGMTVGVLTAIVGILFAGIAPGMLLFVRPPLHTEAMLASATVTIVLGLVGLGVSLKKP